MEITPEVVRELLHYDPDTGVLTWRERGRHWFKSHKGWRCWNGKYAGKRAGCVWTSPKTGYQCRQIRLLDRLHYEHHIAWMWKTDEPLPPEIDHENRDGTDNRWLNLRASSRAANQQNLSMRRDNTSGVAGVCWHKGAGKWMARVEAGGTARYLGIFDDLAEAARVVAEFRAANGFDPGHGMEPAHYHA